jgi:endo-beta-N-acetylglucosaminidase D
MFIFQASTGDYQEDNKNTREVLRVDSRSYKERVCILSVANSRWSNHPSRYGLNFESQNISLRHFLAALIASGCYRLMVHRPLH